MIERFVKQSMLLWPQDRLLVHDTREHAVEDMAKKSGQVGT